MVVTRNHAGRRPWKTLAILMGAVLLVSLAMACDSDDGEDRPGVEVISESGGRSAGRSAAL